MSALGERQQHAAFNDGERAMLRLEIQEMKRWCQQIGSGRYFDAPWGELKHDLRVLNGVRLTGAKFDLAKDWTTRAQARARATRGDVTFDEAVDEIAGRFEGNVLRYSELVAVESPDGRRSRRMGEIQAELGVGREELQEVRSWFHDVRVHYICSRPRDAA